MAYTIVTPLEGETKLAHQQNGNMHLLKKLPVHKNVLFHGYMWDMYTHNIKKTKADIMAWGLKRGNL